MARFNVPERKRPQAGGVRVCLWVPSDLHRRLRATLMLHGYSVSRWFREQAEAYVQAHHREWTDGP